MQLKAGLFLIIGVLLTATGLLFWSDSAKAPAKPTVIEPVEAPAGQAKATFASGCFWCTDAVFRKLKGVSSVVAGYSGGSLENPTYEDVSSGLTGHAEAIQVTYDPKVISYPELLEVFWKTHDPTTPDQQGADHGPQYRSVIFYHTDEQKKLAEEYKAKLGASGIFGAPIVTQIVPFKAFYRAEEEHQNFYNTHRSMPYCQVVIGPKMQKLHDLFRNKLKEQDK
jgi:peptide-methionine (S)-S-oxide reductase